jgi:hypothetical protein
MARSVHTPTAPRVSIAWLARRWDSGLSKRVFIELAISFVVDQGPRRLWWVVERGFMSLRDFTCPNGESPEDYDPCVRSRTVERILLDRSEVSELAARLGISPPSSFDSWAAANDCSGQTAAKSADAAQAPLTREQAVAAIVAAGKRPGRDGYSWKRAEREVRMLCGVRNDARGYSRRVLSDEFARVRARRSPG